METEKLRELMERAEGIAERTKLPSVVKTERLAIAVYVALVEAYAAGEKSKS